MSGWTPLKQMIQTAYAMNLGDRAGNTLLWEATYAALATFGAPVQDIRPEDFADCGSFFRFGRDPNGVDFCPIFRVSILTRA